MFKKILGEEDTRIAFYFGWFVAVPVLAILGYYFGTIAVDEHIVDLNPRDMRAAIPYAALGAGIGALIALFLTFVYPRMVHRDLSREHAVGYESHREEPDFPSSPGT